MLVCCVSIIQSVVVLDHNDISSLFLIVQAQQVCTLVNNTHTHRRQVGGGHVCTKV